jgi:ABC-type polysaccharide/polyol phosphate export permease
LFTGVFIDPLNLTPYGAMLKDHQEFHAKLGIQPHKTKTGRPIMFEVQRPKTRSRSAFSMLELIYHSIVREIRKDHRNAVVGLIMNMIQTIVFVAAFYFMFSVLGLKGSAIRGDFLLYIMSGIFLFITHTKAMGAVLGAEGPASAMMKHAPMNTIVSITSAAIAALYTQVLSMCVVLYLYHATFGPITIVDPIGAMGTLLLAWFSGVAVGMIFLSIKPWFPGFVSIASSIYARANMIASGKMFVANSLPGFMLPIFDWNPLFHCIDQARGYVFINYNPHFTSISYPIKVSIILIMVGLMLEFYTRKNASVSWDAAR